MIATEAWLYFRKLRKSLFISAITALHPDVARYAWDLMELCRSIYELQMPQIVRVLICLQPELDPVLRN